MKIVMDTKDLKDMFEYCKKYKHYLVVDSGDNTDGEGIWHCDVHFDDSLEVCEDGDGAQVYSFNSVYNNYDKYLTVGRENVDEVY